MSLKDELEKMGRQQEEWAKAGRMGLTSDPFEAHGLGAELARLTEPVALRMPDLSPATLRIQRPEERAAESFMEGLRQRAESLESGLQENQEIQMFCYHGPENLRVLEVSMPSENVVSLRCLNADGEEAHVTGHMHSVTFSFLIHTIVPPEVKRPIGFNMPSEGE
jgi:hypothetical protein